MNKNVLYVAVFGVLCVLAGVVVGAGVATKARMALFQDQRPRFSDRVESFMGHGQRKNLLEMFSQRLGLNAEQKTKVGEILEQSRQKIDEAGKNLRVAINEAREKGDARIMGILTPDQQEKFKTMQTDMKKKWERKGFRGKHSRMGKHRGQPSDETLPPPMDKE